MRVWPPCPSGTVSPLVSAPLIICPTPPVLPEMRLTAPGVDGPRGGRREGGVEGVVAHREVLGVVPQPGHRVAVVVVHDVAGTAGLPGGAGAAAGAHGGDELAHLPAVERHLLRAVAVVLVASQDVVNVGRVIAPRVDL